jgi:hypothetical protein
MCISIFHEILRTVASGRSLYWYVQNVFDFHELLYKWRGGRWQFEHLFIFLGDNRSFTYQRLRTNHHVDSILACVILEEMAYRLAISDRCPHGSGGISWCTYYRILSSWKYTRTKLGCFSYNPLQYFDLNCRSFRSWVLVKPPVAQLNKNLPTTQRFITVFSRALHRSLSWARWIQFKPPKTISLRSTLILSSRLRLVLPSGLYSFEFPPKFNMHFSSAYSCYMPCPAYPSRLNAKLRGLSPQASYTDRASSACRRS